MQRILSQQDINTNESMVEYMLSKDIISSDGVVQAFQATDRGFFLSSEGANVYLNSPIREGILHLSAPGIYGLAIEALSFSEGLSFLNVGSGTGYVSAIAARLLGARAMHYGIEIQPKLVEYSRAKLDQLGHASVQLLHLDAATLEPESSMRFDRIYVGAGASEDATFLMRMLEVGGILVGPFDSEGGSQRLIKCVRSSENHFSISELMAVHFTPLARYPRSSKPQAVSLCAPRWSPEIHRRFPPKHRAVIMTMLALHGRPDCLLSLLPKEVLIELIFPHISYSWFSGGAEPGQTPSAATSSDPHHEPKRMLHRALRAAARAIFGGAE